MPTEVVGRHERSSLIGEDLQSCTLLGNMHSGRNFRKGTTQLPHTSIPWGRF